MSEKDTADFLINRETFFWSPEYLDMSAWIEHIPFAFWIIEIHKPKIFVELGVHNGVSYFSFCQAVKRLRLETLCYCVDTWTGDEHSGFYGEDIFAKVTNYNNQEYLKFSTIIRSSFDDAQQYFLDGSLDLLHIDGLHTYDAVKKDFEHWLPKLSASAIVVFHDINVRERNFGVFQFWEELKLQYAYFQFDFGHGLGIISVNNNFNADLSNITSGKHDGYLTFLKNFFYERGSFFKQKYELKTTVNRLNSEIGLQTKSLSEIADEKVTPVLIKNEETKLNGEDKLLLTISALQARDKQLSTQALVLNDLQENFLLVKEGLNQANQIYREVKVSNEELSKHYSEVLENNVKLTEDNNEIKLLNNKLEFKINKILQEFDEIESKKNDLQLEFERIALECNSYKGSLTQMSEKLLFTEKSIIELVNKLAAETKVVETLQKELQQQLKQINWYRATYQERSLPGILKEKLIQYFKKKKR